MRSGGADVPLETMLYLVISESANWVRHLAFQTSLPNFYLLRQFRQDEGHALSVRSVVSKEYPANDFWCTLRLGNSFCLSQVA